MKTKKGMTKTEKAAYKLGIRHAAEIANSYNSITAHPYRLGDCILLKTNQINKSQVKRNTPSRKSSSTIMRETHPNMNILLNPNGLRMVKNGVKSITFREGLRQYTLGKGVICNNTNPNDKINIKITKLISIPFGQIAEEHLAASEYSSVAHFRREMRNIYGRRLSLKAMITIVEFRKVK